MYAPPAILVRTFRYVMDARACRENIEKYKKLLSLEKKYQMTMTSMHTASQATSFVAPSQNKVTAGS